MSSVFFLSIGGIAGYLTMYWRTSHTLSAPAAAINHSPCLMIFSIGGAVVKDSSVIPDSDIIKHSVSVDAIAIVVI